MICVKLFGGLGNQMFQYAMGRAISLRENAELLIDTSFYNVTPDRDDTSKRSFELNIFNLPLREVTQSELKILKPISLRILNTLLYKFSLGAVQFPNYFFENQIGYNKSINKIRSHCYLSGYWQSYKYFENIKDDLKLAFKFPTILDSSIKSIINDISKNNSISIHIRRGDFVNNSSLHFHSLCSIEYYEQAIKYFNDRFSEITFYIFSDDILWVKKHLQLPSNCKFVTKNSAHNSYIDMHLMSLCKHNVIANSSFSWWGAWLNNQHDKIIISPKQWYNNLEMNLQTKDLIPSEWIRI